MKILLRYCPRCDKKTLQVKEKCDLGVFSCYPDTTYFCSSCNQRNCDSLIRVPYPEFVNGEIIHKFEKIKVKE
jgi:hypothetical protein